MIPWGLIIGLLIGGFLMFMLIASDNKKQEKKEKWFLDELDNTLDEYNSISVVYDQYNEQEKHKAYVFYSCLVSKLMWKDLKIVAADKDYVQFEDSRIIRFTTITDYEGIYFVKKNSIMIDFISQDKERYEF